MASRPSLSPYSLNMFHFLLTQEYFALDGNKIKSFLKRPHGCPCPDDLSASRSEGGQRFYTNDDLAAFAHIKDLLYHQGYTITGAKRQLEALSHRKSLVQNTWQEPVLLQKAFLTQIPEHVLTQQAVVKEQLLQLKKRLQS